MRASYLSCAGLQSHAPPADNCFLPPRLPHRLWGQYISHVKEAESTPGELRQWQKLIELVIDWHSHQPDVADVGACRVTQTWSKC